MLNRDELKTTSQAIDKIHLLCVQETKKGSQLLAEVAVLFQCIRCDLFLSLHSLQTYNARYYSCALQRLNLILKNE